MGNQNIKQEEDRYSDSEDDDEDDEEQKKSESDGVEETKEDIYSANEQRSSLDLMSIEEKIKKLDEQERET